MRSFETEVFNAPVWLSPEEVDQPMEVIFDFLDHYHLYEVREVLWEWVFTLMSSDGEAVEDGRKRANIVFFYQKLESLLEAVYLIGKRHKGHEAKRA